MPQGIHCAFGYPQSLTTFIFQVHQELVRFEGKPQIFTFQRFQTGLVMMLPAADRVASIYPCLFYPFQIPSWYPSKYFHCHHSGANRKKEFYHILSVTYPSFILFCCILLSEYQATQFNCKMNEVNSIIRQKLAWSWV